MGGLLYLVEGGGDWVGPQPAQAPPRCTKCNSPPINGQCTNFVLFDVAHSKGLRNPALLLFATMHCMIGFDFRYETSRWPLELLKVSVLPVVW